MSRREIETGTNDLIAWVEDGVAVLSLNRPERRNALSQDMLDGLADTLAAVEVDMDVGCVVITGEGGAFCAGGDVKGMAERQDGTLGERTIDQTIHEQRLKQRATSGKIFTMPKPVIGALPGPAAGAGFAIALACDIRIMSENAFLLTAFANVGFSGDYGGTYFLTQLVGTAKAREMFYLSERVGAEEALALGLTNRVVPQDQLMDTTMEMARRIAAGPRVAYRYMKENLNKALDHDVMECLDNEGTNQIQTGQTADHREATRAFVEKRAPQFTGR